MSGKAGLSFTGRVGNNLHLTTSLLEKKIIAHNIQEDKLSWNWSQLLKSWLEEFKVVVNIPHNRASSSPSKLTVLSGVMVIELNLRSTEH